MALGVRQRRLYKNRCDIYRPETTLSAVTGRPTAKSYTLDASDVKCLFGKLKSSSSPFPMGRGETDNQFSHDGVALPAGTDIGEGWVIKDTSIDRYGNAAESNGNYWIVVGEPLTWQDYGGRRAGHVLVQANRHTIPHSSIG